MSAQTVVKATYFDDREYQPIASYPEIGNSTFYLLYTQKSTKAAIESRIEVVFFLAIARTAQSLEVT